HPPAPSGAINPARDPPHPHSFPTRPPSGPADNLSGPANAGLSVTAVTQGAHGSVSFTASGVTYTPVANYYGSDSFTYTIRDADGASSTATLSATLITVTDAPFATGNNTTLS